MTDHIVTLTISESAYAEARRIAEGSAQTVERVLASQIERSLEDLSGLPPDEQVELAAMQHLSDEVLTTIAQEKAPPDVQERVTVRLALNKRSVLTQAESEELAQLLEHGDRITLRKAQAAAILVQRGHSVFACLKSG